MAGKLRNFCGTKGIPLRRLFFCLDERGSRQIEMQASRLASLLAQKPDDTIESDLDLDELDATSAELKARD